MGFDMDEHRACGAAAQAVRLRAPPRMSGRKPADGFPSPWCDGVFLFYFRVLLERWRISAAAYHQGLRPRRLSTLHHRRPLQHQTRPLLRGDYFATARALSARGREPGTHHLITFSCRTSSAFLSLLTSVL